MSAVSFCEKASEQPTICSRTIARPNVIHVYSLVCRTMTRVNCLFIYKMGKKKNAVGDLLLHKLVNTHIHVDEHIKKQKKKTVGENVRKKGGRFLSCSNACGNSKLKINP